MLTFSLNVFNNNDLYIQRVWDAINKNIRYFKKFNHEKWEEAVQRAFVTALEHRNDDYEDLEPYIKKLARTILRVKDVESPYDVYNENGEVSFVYTKLTESIDELSLVDTKEIKDVFKELYLLDSAEFLKLKNLFKYDDTNDILDIKAFVIRNESMKSEFRKLIKKFSGEIVFKSLYEFFKDLAQLTAKKENERIREIPLREGNYSMLGKIPDIPCIRGENGELYLIDKTSLNMSINPDYIRWDTALNTNCDILKIDISPLINYVYEEIFVDEGVSTRHIVWCGDKYKLISPGGYSAIGADKDKFINLVRIELILNLLMNNINTIIAISPDFIYIKPTRAMQLDTIRLHLITGKLIDLPVSIHIKKRRFSA